MLLVWPDPPLWLMRGAGAAGGGLVFGWLAWRLRFLDASGAVAGGLFGACLLGLGGTAWVVPALVFFVTSSLLSKVGRRRKAAPARRSAKGDVRDAGQVLANGAVAWGLLLWAALDPSPRWYAGFVGALAAAAADTWATEVGTLLGRQPRLITSGRRVPPGTSGAVSWPGTLAALSGAGAVALSAWPFAGGPLPGCAALAGFLAAFVDSLAGALFQARYRDPLTGHETERAGAGGVAYPLLRGHRWLDNDRVNLLGTFFGAALAMACFPAAGFGS